MSDNSGMQSNYQRGVTTLAVLALLKEEDMYGYQLVQEMERQSGGALSTQEGSLYPILYKLLDQGLISDRKVAAGKRMMRIYYHLEPAGLQRLKEMETNYRQVVRGILDLLNSSNMRNMTNDT